MNRIHMCSVNIYPPRYQLSLLRGVTRGQSLIEVILATAVFGLFAASLAGMASGSLLTTQRGGEHTQAEMLAQEALESLKSIRDRAWNENIYSQSGVSASGGEWQYLGEGSTETIGQFTRTIQFDDVCRDGADQITSCPGSYLDPHTRQVAVTVEWSVGGSKTNTVEYTTYLTNWDSQNWVEDTTNNFNDGTFNNSEVSTTLGDGDGAVVPQKL